jgi:hypothetical protein
MYAGKEQTKMLLTIQWTKSRVFILLIFNLHLYKRVHGFSQVRNRWDGEKSLNDCLYWHFSPFTLHFLFHFVSRSICWLSKKNLSNEKFSFSIFSLFWKNKNNEGYTGKNCQFEADPCTPSQCLNGGTCISNTTHFR